MAAASQSDKRDSTKREFKWREPFLKSLAACLSVSAAAEAARISRNTVYNHRKQDPEFAAAWDEALAESIERAEGEMYRRAVEGVEKPVYQGGKHVGNIREFSDVLLIFMLKAHKPDKYRERSENLNINIGDLSDEELERIAKGEHPSAVVARARGGRAGTAPAQS